MSTNELTPREREYLDCQTPLLSSGDAAVRLITGVLASLAQAAFTPGNGKADRRLMRAVREMRYTKYKKAVLRKLSGTPEKNDEKLLKKLNKNDFILIEDTYDPDEFTRQVYEDYMKNQHDAFSSKQKIEEEKESL